MSKKRMRGDSGKNIYSQVLPHTLAQMDTAKAHTHIAMRCELTAVFLCAISCGDFESVRKLSLYLLFLRCKVTPFLSHPKNILRKNLWAHR